MSGQPLIALRDGRTIPQLGLGMYIGRDVTGAVDIVTAGLAAGYRHIDTAKVYRNEDAVGEGVRRSGLAREDVFITTKVWNTDQGYDATLAAFDASLERLGMDHVDLYLIHWPCPARNLYIDTWRALVRIQAEGRAKSIGVSNFNIEHLRRIIGETGVTPVLNQVELHPNFQQTDLRAYHAGQGIATESWSPLGRMKVTGEAIGDIAAKHDRTPAQVIIAWHLQSGLIVIPRSTNPGRIAENFASLAFELDAGDMDAIARLDDPLGRKDSDPLTVN
jgi:2,5-diketo-D-gluconate reductase A